MVLYYGSVLIHYYGSVLWFGAMVLCFGSVLWFCAMVLCYDSVLWFCTMVRCYGSVLWFCTISTMEFAASINKYSPGFFSHFPVHQAQIMNHKNHLLCNRE